MQDNSQCRLDSEWDETVNHISKCSEQAQKEYKNRHDLVGKLIHWELYKNLKFHYTDKWYMHKPESVFENETREILLDFVIQTDHSLQARK